MVDSVSNNTSTLNSLIRAQNSASVSGLRANQQNAQVLTQRLQPTSSPAKSTSITLSSKVLNGKGNLPRGSLVDRLV